MDGAADCYYYCWGYCSRLDLGTRWRDSLIHNIFMIRIIKCTLTTQKTKPEQAGRVQSKVEQWTATATKKKNKKQKTKIEWTKLYLNYTYLCCCPARRRWVLHFPWRSYCSCCLNPGLVLVLILDPWHWNCCCQRRHPEAWRAFPTQRQVPSEKNGNWIK